mmetsp:Transcript_21417/g.66454  ORF Transcript_21417/g.66454 Transcript_21417/m.66454 type:complete len:238 (+) Transcript_21417:401-1114(+)
MVIAVGVKDRVDKRSATASVAADGCSAREALAVAVKVIATAPPSRRRTHVIRTAPCMRQSVASLHQRPRRTVVAACDVGLKVAPHSRDSTFRGPKAAKSLAVVCRPFGNGSSIVATRQPSLETMAAPLLVSVVKPASAPYTLRYGVGVPDGRSTRTSVMLRKRRLRRSSNVPSGMVTTMLLAPAAYETRICADTSATVRLPLLLLEAVVVVAVLCNNMRRPAFDEAPTPMPAMAASG